MKSEPNEWLSNGDKLLIRSCFHADKQQALFGALGSNAVFLDCTCTYISLWYLHIFSFMLIDIWISWEWRQDARLSIFPCSLWAWIYKLKNQAKMTLIRSPSFCRKSSCSAGTEVYSHHLLHFSLTKSISSFSHACSDNAMAPITPLNPGSEENGNTKSPQRTRF